MLTDFFLLQTFFFTYLIYSQKKLGGGIGCHISIFLIFIELAQISSFVQQSTRLKGTFCKKNATSIYLNRSKRNVHLINILYKQISSTIYKLSLKNKYKRKILLLK